MQTEVIRVDGMNCMGCVNKVKTGLESIAGVKRADVSLEQKQVILQYDESEADPQQFRLAIRNAGFESIS
ncbi:heavy-metal-associated domain-containing protein [Nitrosovibrio sp. Nv4]|uniref:heavy-metal-associated domain-containing protein n=1 Tax=Nitrosovibrio sp. Nv4 TaxID=1945880 RepID=UPI000BC7319F|nr:heavy-metal-associated domain-containing protein [Nitrosovibrio sp. Nv4]SOD41523.1 copper chaperone [Nitrosovibrio sp. Nv4]